MCGETYLCVSDHHPKPATKKLREEQCQCEEYLAEYCRRNGIDRKFGEDCPHLFLYPAVLSWWEQFKEAKKENLRRRKAKSSANGNGNGHSKKKSRHNGKSNGSVHTRREQRKKAKVGLRSFVSR